MKMSILLLSVFLFANLKVAATIYEVTTDAEMSNVPWLNLVAGDQVRIHWKSTPYCFKIGIRGRGTKSQPIKITGVPGGSDGKQLPVLSGENAVTNAQFNGFFDTVWDESMALIMIKQAGAPSKPGYIIIEKLKIIKTKLASAYTAMDGSKHHFGDNQNSGSAPDDFTSAIMANPVEHLTVRGCEITDNSLGIFIMSKGDESTTSRDILVEYNNIYGNGVVGDSHEHNIYTEAVGVVFQYNYFGALRPNAEGSTLKDRSAGAVIRYNWFESSARAIDIVEAEDGYPIISLDPEYHKTYIYGNVIVDNIGQSVFSNSMVHYGYDNEPNKARLGPHYFYNNTVAITGTGSPQWDICLFQCGTDWGTKALDNLINIDIRNNILYWNPATIQNSGADGGMDLMYTYGTAHLEGTNWISSNWKHGRNDFVGSITTNGTLLTGTLPGFTNEAGANFGLTETSPVINKGAALPQAIATKYPVSAMYQNKADSIVRTIVGSAIDLGAFEYGAPTAIQTVTYNSGDNSLNQNFPNPFNSTTAISYNVPGTSNVKLIIYDLKGSQIRVLSQGNASTGQHVVEWDGKDELGNTMGSGVYLYQLNDNSGHSTTMKMIFLKN